MSCPKCGARLREETSYSGHSGLMRQDGGSAPTVVSGLSCWRCGFWRDAVVVPVIAGVPPQDKAATYNPAVKVAAHHIAVKFYDSIVRQRAAGVSWFIIASLLTKAGHRVQEKSLQKHFLLEQEKRHDEAVQAA